MVADFEFRAAAPGVKPLRLPPLSGVRALRHRAPEETSSQSLRICSYLLFFQALSVPLKCNCIALFPSAHRLDPNSCRSQFCLSSLLFCHAKQFCKFKILQLLVYGGPGDDGDNNFLARGVDFRRNAFVQSCWQFQRLSVLASFCKE